MSSRLLRPTSLALCALLTTGSLLAGCGFTPLYATPGLTGALSGVVVDAPAHSRTGYLVREKLDDTLGRNLAQPATYRLALSIEEHRYPRGVRVNNVANRYEIQLNVGYILSEAATGRVLLTGSAPAIVSYDSADAPYAGVAAEQDGAGRAAAQAALVIRQQVSRWLARQPG